MNSPYDNDFYAQQSAASLTSGSQILGFLFPYLRPASVVDVGCGVGTWLRAAKELGAQDILGVDGSYVDPGLLLVKPSEFLAFDLEKQGLVDVIAARGRQRFDLVISVEVAEHLSFERAESFVKDLTDLGDVVLFSAAIPFQGGEHHVNEQWPEFWAILFQSHGFESRDLVRPAVWGRDEVDWWYIQNTLLFVKRDSPSARRLPSAIVTQAQSLSVVHPQNYLAQILKWFHTHRRGAAPEEFADFAALTKAYAARADQVPELAAPRRASATPESPDVFPMTRSDRFDPEAAIEALRTDLASVSRERDELRQDLGRLVGSEGRSPTDYRNLALANVGLSEAVSALSSDLQALRTSLAEITSDRNALRDALRDNEARQAAIAEENIELTLKLTELSDAVASINDERSALDAERASMQSERHGMEADLRHRQAKLNELGWRLEELQRSRSIRLVRKYYSLYDKPGIGILLRSLRRGVGGVRRAFRRKDANSAPSRLPEAERHPEKPRPEAAKPRVDKASAPFAVLPEVREILVMKLDHIGDFVLGLPAFRLLRQTFGQARITLLCGPWNQSVAEAAGCFDRICCLALLPEVSGSYTKDKLIFDTGSIVDLGFPEFDIAIDFRDAPDTRFLLSEVKARFRAGFFAQGVTSHLDLAFPSTGWHLIPGSTIHHQTLQMLLAASVVAMQDGPRSMHETVDLISRDAEPVALDVADGRPLVGLNLGSGSAAKNWPLDRFIELAKWLTEDLRASVVLFGSTHQKPDSDRLAATLPGSAVINLAGQIPLARSIATMRQLACYVGNDTGTTHVAAALGIPTVCLFGTETTFESHGIIGDRCMSILAQPEGMGTIPLDEVRSSVLRFVRPPEHVSQRPAAEALPEPAGLCRPLSALAPAERTGLSLVVVNTKSYQADFRKYMMQAAIEHGGDAIHVCCWDKPKLTYRGQQVDANAISSDPVEQICALVGDGPKVVLVGLGLSPDYVPIVRGLRRRGSTVKVLYDVFDYFRYDTRGREFLHHFRLDVLWRRETHKPLLLERGLKAIYPGSWHLENASHLHRLEGPAKADPRTAVYVGSIDRRVDFKWLETFASLDVTLDIYGRCHDAEPEVADRLSEFVAAHENVRYHGEYDNNELSSILNAYRIGIIPYKTRYTMTKHINPDKLYHYLNAGLEVITSDIPQTHRARMYVHLVAGVDGIAGALKAARDDPRNSRWSVSENNWHRRWEQLLELLEFTPASSEASADPVVKAADRFPRAAVAAPEPLAARLSPARGQNSESNAPGSWQAAHIANDASRSVGDQLRGG